MDIKQERIINDIAKQRHDDVIGTSYDELDDIKERGFIVGYSQAIEDICKLMDIDVGDFIINLHNGSSN